MDDMKNPVKKLTDAECFERLKRNVLGRIVTNVADHIDITPINYVLDGESIVFRSAEGTKLTELTINPSIIFQTDHFDDEVGWSVIVRGQARRVESLAEIEECDKLPLKPMVPTLKYNYVRITAESLSGIEFARDEEPDRYGVQPGY